jgi:hypothetical protein
MNRASTLLSIIKSRLTAQDWMRYTDTSQITTVYLSVSWCTQHFFRSKPYAAMRWLSIEGYQMLTGHCCPPQDNWYCQQCRVTFRFSSFCWFRALVFLLAASSLSKVLDETSYQQLMDDLEHHRLPSASTLSRALLPADILVCKSHGDS